MTLPNIPLRRNGLVLAVLILTSAASFGLGVLADRQAQSAGAGQGGGLNGTTTQI